MNKYITVNPNPKNAWRGIGHQFLCFLTSYILSKKYNLKFIWQPFAGDNDGTWASKKSNAFQIDRPVKLWNNFLNFGQNELTLNDLSKNLIHKIQLPYIEQAKWDNLEFKYLLGSDLSTMDKPNVLYQISELSDGQFFHIDWDIFNNNILRNKYHLAKSKQPQTINYLDRSFINIALHRRAGDVSRNTQFNRWKEIDYYIRIINNINKIKFDKEHIIHIYSYDIDEEEIELLSGCRNVKFHINENTFDTFHNMVNCDVLINGQSSFSVLAAYLSYGIKLCTPWGIHWNDFPEQNDLIIINQNGSFDQDKLLKVIGDGVYI